MEGRGLTITLLGSRSLDEEIAKPDSINYEPLGIGGLTALGKEATCIGSLPHQSFAMVLTMLQAGKIKYAIFDGNALRYGHASIKGLTLTGELDPDDYLNRGEERLVLNLPALLVLCVLLPASIHLRIV